VGEAAMEPWDPYQDIVLRHVQPPGGRAWCLARRFDGDAERMNKRQLAQRAIRRRDGGGPPLTKAPNPQRSYRNRGSAQAASMGIETWVSIPPPCYPEPSPAEVSGLPSTVGAYDLASSQRVSRVAPPEIPGCYRPTPLVRPTSPSPS
jgi:hypothetical protein